MIVDKTYKVWWEHKEPPKKLTGELHEFRGSSSCFITVLEYSDEAKEILVGETTLATAESKVHYKDHFDRKKGVYESFKKAVANIPSKAVRTLIWQEYHKERRFNKDRDLPLIQMKLNKNTLLLDFVKSNAILRDNAYFLTIPNNTIKFKFL